jgi:hypothetical protein
MGDTVEQQSVRWFVRRTVTPTGQRNSQRNGQRNGQQTTPQLVDAQTPSTGGKAGSTCERRVVS